VIPTSDEQVEHGNEQEIFCLNAFSWVIFVYLWLNQSNHRVWLHLLQSYSNLWNILLIVLYWTFYFC